MTTEERAKKKAEYTGPRYEITPAMTGRPCEACGTLLYMAKTKSGAFMPVEEDGIPHWGFCSDPGRFKR